MWRSKWILLMEWKMDPKVHTCTHTHTTFFLKWLTILITKNITIVVSFKPSEILYSDSLQQGEWVKLLNRIHSDWLNWSQAKTDLQDLRDSGHRASREKQHQLRMYGPQYWWKINWPDQRLAQKCILMKVLGLHHHSSLYLKHGISDLRHLLIIPQTVHFKIKVSTLSLYLVISYHTYLPKMIWDGSQTYIKCRHIYTYTYRFRAIKEKI